jgi:multidrug efflux pump subunit AcrA (membrane-fusion protein)
MDTVDLFLQRSETQSDWVRFQAEVNRSRAEMNLIETEIGLSRVAQSQARLARLDAFLEQAMMTSPINGVVVEGERQDLLGLPISAGQTLYRIARVEDMYLRIRVSEEDIHFVSIGDAGEFVFLSQPGRRIPFTVSRIVPVANVEGQEGARFDVRGEFQVPAETWWRPGMSGVVKIDQGRKQALWVIFHRVVNRLRLWLWW